MSQTNPRILVIVPAYNEAEVIKKTLSELLEADYEVVLVDDASTDETRKEIAELDIHYLRHSVNLGQGAALMTGMVFAEKKAFDIVVHFDADGQHRVEEIPTMLKPILEDKTDIVLGSRFLKPESRDNVPISRRILLKLAIIVNAIFTKLWLTDAHNGFRALNRKAFTRIKLHENGMAHATEILSEICRNKLRYQEVPVNIRYSSYAKKKGQSAWNSLNILSDLIVRKIFN